MTQVIKETVGGGSLWTPEAKRTSKRGRVLKRFLPGRFLFSVLVLFLGVGIRAYAGVLAMEGTSQLPRLASELLQQREFTFPVPAGMDFGWVYALSSLCSFVALANLIYMGVKRRHEFVKKAIPLSAMLFLPAFALIIVAPLAQIGMLEKTVNFERAAHQLEVLIDHDPAAGVTFSDVFEEPEKYLTVNNGEGKLVASVKIPALEHKIYELATEQMKSNSNG